MHWRASGLTPEVRDGVPLQKHVCRRGTTSRTSGVNPEARQPGGSLRISPMAHDTFQAGDLTAIIGDNGAAGQHREGYNGVWSLTHRREATNLFVPAVSGLNLEHIFDGDRFDMDNNTRRIFFEPRHAPMTFR